MRPHKKTRTPESAQVDDLAQKVREQTTRVMQKAEKLHDTVKRAEDIDYEIEHTVEQAKQTVENTKHRKRAG